jgi:DNA-binding response OmpR family regulator
MTTQILLVDDELRAIRLMEANLRPQGYQTLSAFNGREALRIVAEHQPDLILMDVFLPELDGFTALERIREFSNVPVIMVSARGAEMDRVHGLECGADDYVVKPFSASELVARVRAVLRRSQGGEIAYQGTVFNHGSLRIDYARAEVSVKGRLVSLSATEYRLLLQFAHNLGIVLSNEQLLGEVWGKEYRSDKEILWVSISRLRQKLEDEPKNPIHIVTRSGMGYMMPMI